MTTTTVSPAHSHAQPGAAPSKALHVSLWVVQALLALAFGLSGTMKLLQPGSNPAVPEALTLFIGLSEVFGALGLLLPAATRIKPVLTPLAGLGLAVIMVLAAGFHLSRGELSALPVNFLLGALAAFVTWGRLRKSPIAPR